MKLLIPIHQLVNTSYRYCLTVQPQWAGALSWWNHILLSSKSGDMMSKDICYYANDLNMDYTYSNIHFSSSCLGIFFICRETTVTFVVCYIILRKISIIDVLPRFMMMVWIIFNNLLKELHFKQMNFTRRNDFLCGSLLAIIISYILRRSGNWICLKAKWNILYWILL